MNDKEEKRTPQQNRAMHKYFELLAEALNDAGYTVQKSLAQYKMELDWSPEMIKELVWRPTQKALLNKESTTELSKSKDIDIVYEHINRFISQMGIESIPFPQACSECHEIGKHSRDCNNY